MIFNMNGGGTSLNFSIVGGTSRPGTGSDTLMWDGDTSGLTSVGSYVKVSGLVPANEDLNNGLIYTNTNGNAVTLASDDLYHGNGYINNQNTADKSFVIITDSTTKFFDADNPEVGIYFNKDVGINGLTIPGYTGFEASVKENTIWINTDTDITSWRISMRTPSSPSNGLVWIDMDTASEITFNALKHNSILIYPLSAKQYIENEWVDKVTVIYQGGEWKDFIDWGSYIVKDGLTNLTIKAVGKPHDPSFSSTSYKITQEAGSIKVQSTKVGTGMVYFGPVSLKDADKLVISGEFNFNEYKEYFNFCIWSSIGLYTVTNRTKTVQLTSTGATMDVSGYSGSYYVGITTRNSSTQYIKSIEKQ